MGLAIRIVIVNVIVTGKYFTLGGCCSTTALTGLLIVCLGPRVLWMFLSYVSITVSHILAGAGTSPCLREYFSLGGCVGLESYNIFYNIFSYCTVYFTLGGCISLGMSNAFGGGIVTPLSLELAQWYCWEGLFRLVAFSMAHH